jgi:hypothetical protein
MCRPGGSTNHFVSDVKRGMKPSGPYSIHKFTKSYDLHPDLGRTAEFKYLGPSMPMEKIFALVGIIDWFGWRNPLLGDDLVYGRLTP